MWEGDTPSHTLPLHIFSGFLVRRVMCIKNPRTWVKSRLWKLYFLLKFWLDNTSQIHHNMHKIAYFELIKCKKSLVWEGDTPTPSPPIPSSRAAHHQIHQKYADRLFWTLKCKNSLVWDTPSHTLPPLGRFTPSPRHPLTDHSPNHKHRSTHMPPHQTAFVIPRLHLV